VYLDYEIHIVITSSTPREKNKKINLMLLKWKHINDAETKTEIYFSISLNKLTVQIREPHAVEIYSGMFFGSLTNHRQHLNGSQPQNNQCCFWAQSWMNFNCPRFSGLKYGVCHHKNKWSHLTNKQQCWSKYSPEQLY